MFFVLIFTVQMFPMLMFRVLIFPVPTMQCHCMQ